MKVAYRRLHAGDLHQVHPHLLPGCQRQYIYGFCEGNNGADLYNAVQKAIDAAKAAGADYVIGLGHLGIDEQSSPWMSKEVIANTTGFDAFIDGHSHSTFSETIKDKSGKEVVFEQTGTKLANVGKIIIKADGTITHENIDLNTVEPDAEAAAYIQTITDKFDALQKQVVAKTSVELTINGADGKRAYPQCRDQPRRPVRGRLPHPAGADIAFVNGGGVRDNIKVGDITYGDIIRSIPSATRPASLRSPVSRSRTLWSSAPRPIRRERRLPAGLRPDLHHQRRHPQLRGEER